MRCDDAQERDRSAGLDLSLWLQRDVSGVL